MVSSRQTYDFVISTVTFIEADFWASVGRVLRDKGYRIAFILFDESSRRVVTKNDFPYFNIHALTRDRKSAKAEEDEIEAYARSFGIHNVRDFFIHETLAYHRNDEKGLAYKTYGYLRVLDEVFTANEVKCVIQEMGGFAAYTCVYYAARKHGIDHLFYEPACFPGRVVFNLNTFLSDIPVEIAKLVSSAHARAWAKNYVNDYLDKASLVIPQKDRHLFADMTTRRMVNWFNVKRLSQKLAQKYIWKEQAEFDELWRVFKFNARKLVRRQFMDSQYSKFSGTGKYIYYPLHVPHDVQLTVRSRLFYFQEGIIEYLSRILPLGYELLIKEHPASVGALPVGGLRRLLQGRRNVKLLHPSTNSFDIVKNAAAVVVVNSKVGFEALMQGKRVIVLGEAFYRNKGLTFDVGDLRDLERVVGEALEAKGPDYKSVEDFVAKVYEWSHPGELFAMNEVNHRNIADAVLSHLSRCTTDVCDSRRTGSS